MLPIGPFNLAHHIGVKSVNKLGGRFAFRSSFIGLLVRRRDDRDIGERIFLIARCPPEMPWKIAFESFGEFTLARSTEL